MKRISLSVHDFVDLILRKGDLDNRIFNTLSMEEGTRLHQWYQAKQGPEYTPEFFLSHSFIYGDFVLDMEGRADGIIDHGQDNITVDEIKTTNTDVEAFYQAQKEWHLGQALVYAYIYLKDHKLSSIKVQLTYISQLDTTIIKQFLFIYSAEELQQYIDDLLAKYVHYLKMLEVLKDARKSSVANLAFPFDSMRKGQKEMMEFAQQTVETGQVGFCEAKTGIGKTISALFPYIKAMGDRDIQKIFYLTSKNSIKQVVYDTLEMLNSKGGKLKAVLMTSKDRICLNSIKRHCNPDECPYAKNYYDKVNDVIFSALEQKDLFQEKDIIALAQEYQICPFELQLDLLNYVDIVVGDYNYLFDPAARLARFFEDYVKSPYLLLVDEAHNLPDRVRDMFSGTIDQEEVEKVAKSLGREKGKGIKPLKEDLDELSAYFSSLQVTESASAYEGIMEEAEVPDKLTDILNKFLADGKKYMKDRKSINDEFLNFYYEATQFINLPVKDEKYAYYFNFDAKSQLCYAFSISCLDPRYLIKLAYGAFEGGLCFSATLSPKDYFIDLLGGSSNSMTLYLPSPFDPSNCLVMVDPFVSTKFKDRDYTIGRVVDDILATVMGKVGNYFIFFPSFEYMMKVKPFFDTMKQFDCYYQLNQMDDQARADFLGHFQNDPKRTTLGFSVLGGIFSEGIDLTGDRLIGAIVVSVGLPKMNYISDRIQKYFGEDNPSLGYSYAYVYPGINRVFQAAGRVIRGEEDKGVILYMDTRYSYDVYKNNLEQMYPKIVSVGKSQAIISQTRAFWEKKKS